MLLTLARDLKRRKARERRTLFVAEGVRAAQEVADSTVILKGVLATDAFAESARGTFLLTRLGARGAAVERVSDSDLASASDTVEPQGVLVVAETPTHSLDELAQRLEGTARILVLDAVQDPGNTGALVRTASALGARAVLALPGTADFWNSKTVRGAAGALYRVPAIHCSLEETLAFLVAQHVPLWGTAAGGELIGSAPVRGRLAIAVGNEGNGMSAGVRQAAARVVGLPMASAVESLNVVVAAGIVLYALRP